jgi:hypothetical protein
LLLRHDEENDTTERAETKYCYIFFTGTATLALGTCFSFMRMWEGLNGGWARVSLYSPLLDGVGYVLKGCDAEYQRAGGDYYEARKFGGDCDVMLSESIFRVLEGRDCLKMSCARMRFYD